MPPKSSFRRTLGPVAARIALKLHELNVLGHELPKRDEISGLRESIPFFPFCEGISLSSTGFGAISPCANETCPKQQTGGSKPDGTQRDVNFEEDRAENHRKHW
jgi:hypothetical protein